MASPTPAQSIRVPGAVVGRTNVLKRASFPEWKLDRFHKKRKKRSSGHIAFIEDKLYVPSGKRMFRKVKGKRFRATYKLIEYQKDLVRETLDGPEVAVFWSLPRGAGKTGLIAALAVSLLYEKPGADIGIASHQMRTARQSFDRCIHMVEDDPELLDLAIVHRGSGEPYIELPSRNAYLRALPGDASSLVGQANTCVIIDEIGFTPVEVLNVMQSGLGKSDEGFKLIAVGTPGLGITERDGSPNCMYQMRSLAASPECPPTLKYIEHSAPPDADPDDPITWRKANPGLGKLISQTAVEHDHATLSSNTFRLFRLGQWVQHESSFIMAHDWDALRHEAGLPPDGATVTLGYDGSSSGDSTALVMYEVERNRLHVMGHWTPPRLNSRSWRVPRQEVEDAVARCFRRWRVVDTRFDPWLWRAELQHWQETWGEGIVKPFETNRPQLMGPATDAFRGAVEHGTISTDGHEQLRSHVLSAVAKVTPSGDILQKDMRKPARIDLCIAAVLAYEAGRNTEPPLYVV